MVDRECTAAAQASASGDDCFSPSPVERSPTYAPICQDAPLPRYKPGQYDGECIGAEIYRDPRLRAWKCRVDFRLLLGGEPVSAFFHLGRRDRAHAGRGSEYFRSWLIANGGPPKRRQVMSDRTFKGKIFELRVEDVKRRFDGRPHPDGVAYSVVREIIRRIFP